jgi:hypothetical protein
MKITLGSYQIFQKIEEIFTGQGAPRASKTPAANLPAVPLVLLIPVTNNGNNIRLLTP